MGMAISSIEQNAQILSSFGLTVKQAKVYLALVSLGTAPVGEISKLSKVRREEVYRILPKLEKMGLIEKTLTAPVKLKAASVDNALSILIREEEESSKNRLIELTAKKQEFLEHFRTGSKDGKLGNGEQFSIISEKAVGLSKIESFIDSARTEIEFCVSREKLLQFLKFFAISLGRASARGAKIRIISTTPIGQDEIPKAVNQAFLSGKSITIRYLQNLPNHFLITDQKEVLVATAIGGYLADSPLLWSNNTPHVSVYKRLFEELWNSAVESAALTTPSDDEKLLAYLSHMKPSTHASLLYETTDAKLKVLLNFAKYAVDSKEALIYVCSEASVEETRVIMAKFGIDVKTLEKSGALKILDYTQQYIIDGKFSAENTVDLWRLYYKDAISKGFKGLKVIEETDCFFKHNMQKELVHYEKLLHQMLDYPLIALGAYCTDKLSKPGAVNIYPELVKLHGNVSFTWADKTLGRVAIS
jgi:sugar-specific transcriptional regulator TrmB